jgi:hypothetical protein
MFRSLSSSLFTLTVLFAALSGGAVSAADVEDSHKQAEAQFEKILDEVGVFYKVTTKPSGKKEYVVLFQTGDATSQIYIMVRRLGTSGGNEVYGFTAYSPVVTVPEGQTLPPAVIKMAVNRTDTLFLGSYSVSDDFRSVFSNVTGVVDGLTKPSLKLTLLYLHENKHSMRKDVEPVLKEAAQ